MIHIALIFIGAGLGAVLRYGVSNAVHLTLGKQFPYGTLMVNLTGCFLMGLLFFLMADRFNHMNAELQSLLLIGLLGGYTTFSTFSIETLHLIENGQWAGAAANIVISALCCVAAAWLGMLIAKSVSA